MLRDLDMGIKDPDIKQFMPHLFKIRLELLYRPVTPNLNSFNGDCRCLVLQLVLMTVFNGINCFMIHNDHPRHYQLQIEFPLCVGDTQNPLATIFCVKISPDFLCYQYIVLCWLYISEIHCKFFVTVCLRYIITGIR